MAETPEGLCQCGCGESAGRWTYTSSRWGAVRGQFRRFVDASHGHRKLPVDSDLGRFKIEGVYCRLIPLDKGLYAIVWEADYEYLKQFRWVSRWNPTARTHYAIRYHIVDGKRSSIFMHRAIMGAAWKDGLEVDHVRAGDGLDNRRTNLRFASRTENMMNRRISKNNKLGIKGIFRERSGYCAVIVANGRRVWRRRSRSLEKLIEARNAALPQFHGEFARSA